MVLDKLSNAEKYFGLGDRIKKALLYIKENDFGKIPDGKYEIDGNKIYASVMRYESKPVEKGSWEVHRKYIDVQYVAGGKEKMGYANLAKLNVSQEYVEEKDIMMLTGDGDFFLAEEGTFAIFYPADGHMPGMAAASPQKVLKVVVKVMVD
jgi:YhcH/YjgK/YiaL family protein